MSTVNFSVPEEVKEAFNRTFEGQNKSAIIASLMMEAVERSERRRRSRKAFQRIIERRAMGGAVTQKQVRQARRSGRP